MNTVVTEEKKSKKVEGMSLPRLFEPTFTEYAETSWPKLLIKEV